MNEPIPMANSRGYSCSLGFIRFYWVLLGFTGFYWVLLGSTGFLVNVSELTGSFFGQTSFQWPKAISKDCTKEFTEFSLVLLGFTGFYWVSLGSTGFIVNLTWVLLSFREF